jgi:transcriptional regulator with XRE-family HTH domain
MSAHSLSKDQQACARKARKRCGMTQADLALAARVSQGKISRFENGEQGLSEGAFLRVEQALLAAIDAHRAELVTADQLAGYAPSPRFDSTTAKLISTQRELIALLRQELDESIAKDARIAELEQRVSDLRELYDAGTKAALAHAKFEELKEKVER